MYTKNKTPHHEIIFQPLPGPGPHEVSADRVEGNVGEDIEEVLRPHNIGVLGQCYVPGMREIK